VTWGGLTGSDMRSEMLPRPIITMEDTDDDDEDEEGLQHTVHPLPPEGDHGPFNSLPELLNHSAHLAIFLNYVILIKDPAPLLFYLITDAYKAGTVREMRKWAYEIHSSFLVPRAPLELPNLDSSIHLHIDKFLAEDQTDRIESLQKLFWKARSKARDILKVQLDDFRAQRAAGLSGMFGPPDSELKVADETSDRKLVVINERLVPLLDSMAEDLENASDKMSTLCAALATVMAKIFITRCPKALAIIDKIPTFVSKEKKKERFLGRFLKNNVIVQGHHFQLNHYDQVTYCNHSQGIIWGVGPQGYQCTNCDFNVHKKFVHKVEEACVGSNDKKKRISGRVWGQLPESLRSGGKSGGSNLDLRTGLQVRMGNSKNPSVSPSPLRRDTQDTSSTASFYVSGSEDQPDTSLDQTSELSSPGGELPHRSHSSISDNSHSRIQPGGKNVDLKRSESAKDGEQRKLRRQERRKGSNPELPSGKASSRFSLTDVELVSKSGSSSSSSIAEIRLWEATTVLHSRTDLLQRADSDLADPDLADPPDWRSSITPEQLARLSSSEQKRQDVINELFHTERSHVRNLKVLDQLFRRPLLESGLMPREVVDRLFPNLEEVLSVHQSYNNAMKHLDKGGFPIGTVHYIMCIVQ
jgi:hypothetical protein